MDSSAVEHFTDQETLCVGGTACGRLPEVVDGPPGPRGGIRVEQTTASSWSRTLMATGSGSADMTYVLGVGLLAFIDQWR
jgi:hypothetical protein